MTVSDRELMLLHDGELDPERAKAIRAVSPCDPTITSRLTGLEQLSDFTRAWARARGKVVDPARARRVRWRSRVGFALGAVAASVLGVLLASAPLGSDTEGRPSSRGAASTVDAEAAPAVSIESVDFGSHPGTIFSVRGAGTDITVVWLSDDGQSAPAAAL
jgi:hypothetical protein